MYSGHLLKITPLTNADSYAEEEVGTVFLQNGFVAFCDLVLALTCININKVLEGYLDVNQVGPYIFDILENILPPHNPVSFYIFMGAFSERYNYLPKS